MPSQTIPQASRILSEKARHHKNTIIQVKALPAIPLMLSSIIECANDENSSITQLRDLILQEQAVTAQVLKMANSKFVSQRKKISTVTEAVVTIGFQTVVDVAVSITLSRSFSQIPVTKEMDLREFWLHTLAAAEAGRLIAKRTNIIEPEVAYLLGLLHDLGKLIELHVYRSEFEDALFDARAECKPLHIVELDAYEYHHGDAGMWLGEVWNLPDRLQVGMQFHHDPNAIIREFRLDAQVAHCANYFAHLVKLGNSGNPIQPPVPEEEFTDLGITRHTARMITADLQKQSRKLGSILHAIQL